MKHLFTAILAVATSLVMGTLPLARAGNLEATVGNITLPFSFGALSTVDGWKLFPGRLEEGDKEFSGTFEGPDGEELEVTGTIQTAPKTWETTLKWKTDAEIPKAFLISTCALSQDQFETAKISSGAKNISFEKIFGGLPAVTSMAKVTDFMIMPSDGANLNFTFDNPIDIEVVRMGEKIDLRIFITPSGGDLPAEGSLNWKITQD